MRKNPFPPIIPVAAAVIERPERILIARRCDKGPFNGKWEFPGGKIEPGETAEKCLVRELAEEFGITAVAGKRLTEVMHEYGTGTIRLIAIRVPRTTGRFVPTDHDRIVWVTPERLLDYDLAPADLPVARLLAEKAASRARRPRKAGP